MKLVVTIDTEEDNWGCYSLKDYSVENIVRIPSLQQLFDDFNTKPTYLITYPVAADEKAVSILRKIAEKELCEIGSHCHPWNTPPFEEERNNKNSMLCNLPEDLQYRKIQFLHETIKQKFGIEPISFRAGRWGYSREVARNLYKTGYKIDTSITPYTDWRDDHGPDFSDLSPQPYRFSSEDAFQESSNGHLVEIPATIGYFQRNFAMCNRILKALMQRPANHLVLHKVLYKLNLLNRVWLSPEVADGKTMIRLARRMLRNKSKLINLFFHSPSLKSGLTPFVRTREDENKLFERIKEFLFFAQDAGIESIKLSDSLSLV